MYVRYMYTNSFSLFGLYDLPLHGVYNFHLLARFKGPMLLIRAVFVNFKTNSCGSPTVIKVFLCL
jgi:hypothetical protein